MKLRVLIADDETSARRRLLQFIALDPTLTVVAECRNGKDAVAEIRNQTPDVAFLDVQMPELNGLEVIKQIGADNMPATVLVTAFEDYAVLAYDNNVVDYLLKPFDQERFARAIQKVNSWLSTRSKPIPNYLDRLLVKSGESQQLVRIAEITHITAEGNYIRLHTPTGSHLMRERMVGIEGRLDPTLFKRIHRSTIVNLDHVDKRLPWFGGDYLILMKDGKRLTLSRSFKDAFNEFEK